MTSDDHLRHTLAALTDHLRGSVTREILGVATTIAGWQDSRIEGLIGAGERVRDAVRSIDQARSLTEILDALASAAAREAPRVAVLLVRDGRLRSWRTTAFDLTASTDSLDVPMDEDDIVGAAVRERDACAGDASSRPGAPRFAALPPGATCVAVPLTMNGEVVGMLYADRVSATPAEPSTWPEAMEVLGRHASRALEAMTAFKTAQLLAIRPGRATVKYEPGSQA